MLARSLGDRKRPAQIAISGVNCNCTLASMISQFPPAPPPDFSVFSIPLMYLLNEPDKYKRALSREKSLERPPSAAAFSTEL